MMSAQIVGTAPENVTASALIMSVSGSACRNRFGITTDAPQMNEAYGMPHAFAWNIGTIVSTRSRSESPSAVGVVATSECRYDDRCEYATPLGLPVVPDV